MGWRRPTINLDHVNPIICRRCRQPREIVRRKDDPKAFDYPTRLAPHSCAKKKHTQNKKNKRNQMIGHCA